MAPAYQSLVDADFATYQLSSSDCEDSFDANQSVQEFLKHAKGTPAAGDEYEALAELNQLNDKARIDIVRGNGLDMLELDTKGNVPPGIDRRALVSALDEFGSIPDFSGINPEGITFNNGVLSFRYTDTDGKKYAVNTLVSSDGGVVEEVWSQDATGAFSFRDVRVIFDSSGEYVKALPLPDEGAIEDYGPETTREVVLFFAEGYLIGKAGIGIARLLKWSKAGKSLAEQETVEQYVGKALDALKGSYAASGKRLAQVTINRTTGKATERWVADTLFPGYRSVGGAEGVNVPGKGWRWIDIVTQNGLAVEVKSGYIRFQKDIPDQVAKDAIINTQGIRGIQGVQWVFVKSILTGKGGPAPELRAALQDAKIPFKCLEGRILVECT